MDPVRSATIGYACTPLLTNIHYIKRRNRCTGIVGKARANNRYKVTSTQAAIGTLSIACCPMALYRGNTPSIVCCILFIITCASAVSVRPSLSEALYWQCQ